MDTQDCVYVWCVNLADIVDKALLQQYWELLSPAERAKQQRYTFPSDQHRDLVTRALVRTTLSRFADVAPADWCFSDNGYGRPVIDARHPCATALSFNVSHSGNWVVMAVGHGIDVGVDTESLQSGAPLELTDRCFTASEALELRRLPREEQPLRFFALWTLKESYIKARGLGLSLALDRFAFDLREQGGLVLHCDPTCDGRPRQWRFVLARIDAGHLVSLCLRVSGRQPVDAVWFRLVPLRGEAPMEMAILQSTGESLLRDQRPAAWAARRCSTGPANTSARLAR